MFYAGHGLGVDQANYLVPLGATIKRENHVRHRCVSLDYLLGALDDSRASLKVVVLDCCRDNPYRQITRSKSRGMASVEAPDGTIVSFSTAPGQVALDGEGSNSPFTKHLAGIIKADHPNGLTLVSLFELTAQAVRAETHQRGFMRRDISMKRYFIKPKFSIAKNIAREYLTQGGQRKNSLQENPQLGEAWSCLQLLKR